MNEDSRLSLQAGQAAPFAGRLVDSERNETEYLFKFFDMLNNAGLYGANKVEVWGNGWNDIFRIATRCEICKRGARLYALDMGFAKRIFV